LDFRKAVEDVELGQRDAVDPADRDGLPHHHRVEPAAAPGPPGHDPALLASLAERAADLVVLLGRERAGSDPGGIGLGDAEHVTDRSRPETTADGSARRNRIRGSNEGISAVIDVEHRPLRTLEQDALPSATRGLETVPHAVDERRD